MDLKSNIPLFVAPVPAGFPGFVDDKVDRTLDLNEYCIKHPAATFYVRSSGLSMIGAGIGEDDILIVDRSLEPSNNSVIIAVVNGEFTVKRILRRNGNISLIPENPKYSPIRISESMDFEVWGVVTHVIKKF